MKFKDLICTGMVTGFTRVIISLDAAEYCEVTVLYQGRLGDWMMGSYMKYKDYDISSMSGCDDHLQIVLRK